MRNKHTATAGTVSIRNDYNVASQLYGDTLKIIGEPWFPGLTLKTLLNWDLYWNKCTLYIKIKLY
jgi:hypothetical protein